VDGDDLYPGFEAMGLTAVVLIYSPLGKRPGAHLNPAVTLTFCGCARSPSRTAAAMSWRSSWAANQPDKAEQDWPLAKPKLPARSGYLHQAAL
jgi:hypothetical protein